MLRETVLVFAAALLLASATEVNECDTGDASNVEISGCDGPPCKLKRGTDVTIQQVFTPVKDIQSLRTAVNAKVFNVPLPFIGVDGTDACAQIHRPDGTKAGCPLKKGEQYLYKNTFPILKIYPPLAVEVHYSLVDSDGPVTCFEVPSKIVP